jgi:hypothetical protein
MQTSWCSGQHQDLKETPQRSIYFLMTLDNFRLGPIASPDELEELWAIDNAAYGATSITYEKFQDWWRAYPPGLLVLIFSFSMWQTVKSSFLC